MRDSGVVARTEKQQEIMDLILKAADAGEFLTIRKLKAKLSYGSEVSLQALQSSVRHLEKHQILSRSYATIESRKQLILKPTAKAYSLFRR